MLNILSIGNSFSEDAQRYLYKFAVSAGEELYTLNYCIGGCSLERHRNNFAGRLPVYDVVENGELIGHGAVVNDILTAKKWDVITLQQVSQLAGMPESYEPYLGELVKAVRELAPGARIMFQETWEYEYCSTHGGFANYENSCEKMFANVKSTARAFAEKYGLELIPSGEVIHAAKQLMEFDSEHGGQSLYRDGFHLHFVYGRFLLTCVWYKAVFGKSPIGSGFVPTDGASDPELLRLLENTAETAF